VTTVANAKTVRFASGSAGMHAYTARHEFNADVNPLTLLPGARVPRSRPFDGLTGDHVFMASWISPGPVFQFSPSSSLIGSAYFSNVTRSASEAVPIQKGEGFDIAVVNHGGDLATTWDRKRAASATGQLGWDVAVDRRAIRARIDGAERSVDAVFFRATLRAVGGDVDARSANVDAPPLIIPLGKTYGPQATATTNHSANFPYTHYLGQTDLRADPASGTATLTASARGYIPQGRELKTAGGRDLKEWHLPISGFVLVKDAGDTGGATSRAAVTMSGPGEVVVGDHTGTRTIGVEAGDTVISGPDIPFGEVVPAPGSARSAGAGPAPADPAAGRSVTSGGRALDELTTAADVDASLSAPVDISASVGKWRFTLDPDYRGTGALAIRDLRDGPTAIPYAGAISVPFVRVAGETVPLRKENLLDLQVQPVDRQPIAITTLYAEPFAATRTTAGSSLFPGFVVQAAYDIGNGRVAFVEADTSPENLTDLGGVDLRVAVRAINGTFVPAAPVLHQELPPGPLTLPSGAPATTETSFPLDFDETASRAHVLRSGPLFVTASAGVGPKDGNAVLLAGGRPPVAAPEPDPSVPLGDGPATLVYTAPADVAAAPTARLSTRLPNQPLPAPAPPALGAPCGTTQVQDPAGDGVTSSGDIRRAWLTNDGVNLYATVAVTDLPASAPIGTKLSWVFTYRTEHLARYARASVDAAGAWTFEEGHFNAVNYGFGTPSTGGVRTGPDGLVRIVIPRRVVAGSLLRDTSARSLLQPSNLSQVRTLDIGPDGPDSPQGLGGEYTLGQAC